MKEDERLGRVVFFIGLFAGVLLTFSVMDSYHSNKYVEIRSKVFRATSYDISYPEQFKGCK